MTAPSPEQLIPQHYLLKFDLVMRASELINQILRKDLEFIFGAFIYTQMQYHVNQLISYEA